MLRMSRPWVMIVASVAAIVVAGCSSQPASVSSATARTAPEQRGAQALAPAASAPGRYSLSATRSRTVCVSSAQMGHCPFGPYPGITGASTDPYVDQNVWNPVPGWRQTLHATDPGHWYVTANMPAGNTAVVSFPNTGFYYNKALSGFSSIVSSFTDSIPIEGRNQRRGLLRHLVYQHEHGPRGDDPERLLARAGPWLRDLDS